MIRTTIRTFRSLTADILAYRAAHLEFIKAGNVAIPIFRRALDFSAWSRLRHGTTTPLEENIPWMTLSSIRFLKKTITPGMEVFEWGMGGSTLFFLNRASKVVSVEHDPHWFGVVNDAIPEFMKRNWVPICEPPQRCEPADCDASDPSQYRSTDPEYANSNFQGYCTSISRFTDQKFDLILVDGRSRPGCLVNAFNKVKVGGWLVLDNAERKHYHACLQGLDAPNWKYLDLSGPGPCNSYFWSTWFWRRIA